MDIYQLLRTAVQGRQQAIFDYEGRPRFVCPHAVGTKSGILKVMTFQFDGYSSQGLPPGGDWRCYYISKIQNLTLRQGQWHTGSNHSRMNTCIDIVDVETRG